MLATMQISLNIFLLGGLCIFFALLGFLLRSGQLSALNTKVQELEKEMLASHAEILDLQRERVGLIEQLDRSHQPTSPVIPISTPKEEAPLEKTKEVSSVHKKIIPPPKAKHS